MPEQHTSAHIERALRARAKALHGMVTRWVIARKMDPVGPWKERRDLANLLTSAAETLKAVDQDARNWKTTSSVVLRKYNDLIQGINKEPHDVKCPARMNPGKAGCLCWKKRVHEFEVAESK